MNAVATALKHFVEHWKQLHEGNLPQIDFDAQSLSPCYTQTTKDGHPTTWQPTAQSTPTDMFERLADALETPLHPDIIAYYSSYWSDPLLAQSSEGDLVLLHAWNEADMERLRGNLIGHALNKRRQRLPLTLFFACTEPDDGILSINNQDGSVWLEYPGKPPIREIAPSLGEFLARLTPRRHT